MRTYLGIVVAIAAYLAMRPVAGLCQVDESILNSTVLVGHQVDATHRRLGTGFLLFHPISTDDARNRYKYWLFLVTNKHVLPPEGGSREIALRIAVRTQGRSIQVTDVNVPVIGPDGKYLKSVAHHRDPKVDVAIVRLGRELIQARANFLYEVLASRNALTTDLLVPKEKLTEKRIGIASEVYLVGYPSGIYDSRNAFPIVRVGIISTQPEKDFAFNEELRREYDLPSTLSGFLVDANVFPGSSGSMVVAKTGITLPGAKIGSDKSVPYILGIVSKSIPIEDFGHTQRMGLGVVYGADTILEAINLFLSKQ